MRLNQIQSKWQDVTDDATIHHDSWSCFEKTSQKIQRFQFGNTFYSCDLVKVKYMRSYTASEKEVQTLTLRRVYSKFHKHVIHAVIERLRPWKKTHNKAWTFGASQLHCPPWHYQRKLSLTSGQSSRPRGSSSEKGEVGPSLEMLQTSSSSSLRGLRLRGFNAVQSQSVT
jgi:hypothetical protein